MSSKTFKSAEPDNRELEIDYIFGKPRLLIKDFDGDNTGFIFNESDAASMMLAIGETLPVPDMVLDGSYEHFMATAIHCLSQAVKAQESETKEQVELESEALEYWKAFNNATELVSFDDLQWSDLLPEAQAKWLAVARRAREKRNEKKETTND